jgi:hypothetical protein
MTLLDAKQFDEKAAGRKKKITVISILVILILAWVGYHLRYYPERSAVDKFFIALQKQDYDTAYAIWFHDPDFRQHPQKYASYAYNDFYRDWGPGGEWGLIKNHSIDCSLAPGSTGVIVQVTVNGRAEHPYIWVDKSDKTLSFSPNEIQCGNWWAWLVE